MRKVREVECYRHNVSPNDFYRYCQRQAKKKGQYVEDWIEYDYWVNPSELIDYHVDNHEDWKVPQKEGLKIHPYDVHMWLENTYNVILEWDDGIGYMYIVEYAD